MAHVRELWLSRLLVQTFFTCIEGPLPIHSTLSGKPHKRKPKQGLRGPQKW